MQLFYIWSLQCVIITQNVNKFAVSRQLNCDNSNETQKVLRNETQQFNFVGCTQSKFRMIRSVMYFFFLTLNISHIICSAIPSGAESALLVVSYDAFRPEYLNRNVTPNLNKFRKEGTSAQFMLNVFPTKTFVNHFTIATVSKKEMKINSNFILIAIAIIVQSFKLQVNVQFNSITFLGLICWTTWSDGKWFLWLKTGVFAIQLWNVPF